MQLVDVSSPRGYEALTDDQRALITQGERARALEKFLASLLDEESLIPGDDFIICPKGMVLKDDISAGIQFTPETMETNETIIKGDGCYYTGHEVYACLTKATPPKLSTPLLGINHAYFLYENYWRISKDLVGKSVVFLGSRFFKKDLISEKNDFVFVMVLDIHHSGPPSYNMKCLKDTLCHHYLIATG